MWRDNYRDDGGEMSEADLIENAYLSFAQAKEKVIVNCINDLIKRDVLVFYETELKTEFDSETNTLNLKSSCLLRESDKIRSQTAEIEKLKKQLEVCRVALEFYASSDVWQHISPDKATWSVIDSDDLGDGEFDFNELTDDLSVGGKKARQALAEIEEMK